MPAFLLFNFTFFSFKWKYIKKFLMLASRSLAGVAPEVNMRNPSHAGEKAHKQGIYPGFEPHGRHHQKSKTGVSMVPQMSSNLKKKYILLHPRVDYGSLF